MEMVFAGVDIKSGNRPSTCAIVNDRRRVIHVGEHDQESLVSLLSSYDKIACGIDAPCSRNLGIMEDPDYREMLGLRPNAKRFSSYRVSEFEIRRRGIHIYATPRELSQNTSWMGDGWRLYDALRLKGFRDYPSEANHLMFETYPHADFTVLIGTRPYPKNTLEGRIQRQLVLNDQGIALKDAMHLIEEWTRYRFITGRIDFDQLYTHDQLDALVAAYTAYLAATEPEMITAVGDQRDGLILLPVSELRESYLTAD